MLAGARVEEVAAPGQAQMGKLGADTAAKAEPKKKAAPGEKDKVETTKLDPAKAAAEAKEASEKAKLLEEATQAWADDEKSEQQRAELREGNRKVKKEGAKMGGNRDKGISRVTKFQNKLKLFKGESSELASVMSDIDGVDASKYVVELAECILEAAGVTTKLKELFACVKVCSRLNATYEEFGALLAKSLEKTYKATPAGELNKRRFLLRLCVELFLVECVPKGTSPLLDIIKELCDISLPEEQVVTNLAILVSMVQKHAITCLNIVPAKQKAYEEALGKPWVERQCVLSDDLRTKLMQLIINAYQGSAAGLLQAAHTRLVEQEKVNAKLRVDKGQVDADNEQKHQLLKEGFTKLQATLTTLSESLNQPLPKAEEENPDATRVGVAAVREEVVYKEEVVQDVWEDSEQQRFYEETMDCKVVIPSVLLGGGKPPPAAEASPAAEAQGEQVEEMKKDEEEKKAAPTAAVSDLELFLTRVAMVEGCKQVDDLIQEFFHDYNTKGARKQLAQRLYDVSRAHNLAFRGRFIATVAPYLRDVPAYVLSGLQQELAQHIADKDQGQERLAQKVKTVRYLCELCKFKVCPPGVVLDALKTFCDDFSQHHAELCANLLQCCGRFLLYTPETATRTENLLERMMRLKNSKPLPLALEIQIEDAYYQLKPPEGKKHKSKEKDPLELFVHHLIYERLYVEEEDDKILKLARKLPWDGPAPGWMKKCILELNLHCGYENIYQLASLLSGLAKYRDAFVIDVIDSLFENIQTSIERNDFREAPVRVRQVKLLGELYNYRLVDSNIVFDCMYHLVGFGGPTMHRAGNMVTAHKVLERALAARRSGLGGIAEEEETPGASAGQMPPVLVDPQHPAEAAWDFFRIKLVCVLMETCGHYFDRGIVKQKLDRFLIFFQRYVLSKGELPLRMTYMVSDMMERLRPKLTLYTELAAVDKQILKMLQSERETLDLEDDDLDNKEDDKDGKEEEESSEEEEGSSDEESSSSGEGSESESSSSESEDEKEGATGATAARKPPQQRDRDYSRGEATRRQNEEEEDFDKEMQVMLIESLEREKNVNRVLKELPTLPPVAKRPEGALEPVAPTGVSGNMFSLMQKRTGGKVLVKQIEIPDDCKLTRVAHASVEAEPSREQEDLKRFIIAYDKTTSATGAPSGASVAQGGFRMGGGMPIMLRQGMKGASKGRGGRRNEDYLKDEFLPEDQATAPELVFGAPTLRANKGGNAGSAGGPRVGKGCSGYPSGSGGKGRKGESSQSSRGA